MGGGGKKLLMSERQSRIAAQLELIGGCRLKGAPSWALMALLEGCCLKTQTSAVSIWLGQLKQGRPLGSLESKSFIVHVETKT